jgi:hypothetical protein
LSTSNDNAAASKLREGAGGAGGGGGGEDEPFDRRLARAVDVFPKECPIEPVGTCDGIMWVITYTRELRGLSAKELSRNGLSALVGIHQPWLIKHYGRPKKGNVKPDSFRPEAFADSIIRACTIMGVWKPTNHIRGRGAWLGEDRELVVHVGDQLRIKNRYVDCGRRGDYVYPVRDRLVRPARDADAGGHAAQQLMRRLSSFNLRRGRLDRVLLLGWIVQGFIGGALDVRAHTFLTGERGTGKSTLQMLLAAIMGPMLVQSSDATAAGLWQALQYDSLPVVLDELENEADNSRVDAIIKLARQATSGGVVLRGGADHQGAQFSAKSPFLFASINMPALRAQDRSRMVQIDLLPLEKMQPFSVSGLDYIGRALFRRAIDEFARLDRDVLPAVKERLQLAGWDARGASVYGSLLACASIALHDQLAKDELEDWVAQLEEARMSHRADEAPTWRRCLDHLLAVQVDPMKRGERRPVGSLVLQASGYGDGMTRTREQEEADALDPAMRGEATAARQSSLPEALTAHDQLRAMGLRIDRDVLEDAPATRFLAVANGHPGLSEVFRGTDWASEPGRPGAWRQALGRAPGAQVVGYATRFRGVASRAVLVPLEAAIAGLVGAERPADGVDDPTRRMYRPDETQPAPLPEPGSIEPEDEEPQG